jgi:CxxC motif-containing protein (DUF1111 family)
MLSLRKIDTLASNIRIGRIFKLALIIFAVALQTTTSVIVVDAQKKTQVAVDPGVRGGPADAGAFISGLTAEQQATENALFFDEINLVAGGTSFKEVGLGPAFNSNSCSSCHAQPAVGGSSAPANPLFSVYQAFGATNAMPFFETIDGPTVVARFPLQSDFKTPDGHVHQMFVITGRSDAGSCKILQPDFATAAANNDLILRQTTPIFGGGLIEILMDSDILANMNANQDQKLALGISGHPNFNTDDGSVDRFGWKSQIRSLYAFAGEAYNVEEGVSNEFTPNKLNETPGCTPPFPLGPPVGQGPKGVPDDRTSFPSKSDKGTIRGVGFTGDLERFGIFMRFLAAPVPGACPGGDPASCVNGQAQFNNVGCVLCHTTSFTTPPSSVAALGNVQANLFSDLLVHHVGPCLADNVPQGQAAGDEFRTAPLWGVGQRIFFLHDGRTRDIVQAIEAHSCAGNNQYPASESNGVISNFNALSGTDQQDLINFLRSL